MNKQSNVCHNFFFLIICSVLFINVARADTASLAGNADTGGKLFLDYSCYACHGYTGETGSGTRLNPLLFTQVEFISYVRNPSGRQVRRGPAGRMPAYNGKDVTDQNLTDIYVYLKSLPSGSPPVEEIPLLNSYK